MGDYQLGDYLVIIITWRPGECLASLRTRASLKIRKIWALLWSLWSSWWWSWLSFQNAQYHVHADDDNVNYEDESDEGMILTRRISPIDDDEKNNESWIIILMMIRKLNKMMMTMKTWRISSIPPLSSSRSAGARVVRVLPSVFLIFFIVLWEL